MSSISWNEYLRLFVDILRNAYEIELSNIGVKPEVFEEIRSFIKLFALPKPCQIKVFEFSSINRVLWIVSFDENKPDKEFEIVEEIKEHPTAFLQSHKEYEPYTFCIELAGKELEFFPPLTKDEKTPSIIFLDEKNIGLLFFINPRKTLMPRDLALNFFYERRIDVLRLIQRHGIEKTASKILRETKMLSKTKPSPALREAEKALEDALEKLKKIDEYEQKLISITDELTGLRKLVGTKTFGEWKVLLAEIDKINTRIDALSNMMNAYDKVLSQQSSFITWIKYATILVPVAVVSVPIIELLLRHFLGV